MIPLGQTVRRWRLERGMSQSALAQASGVPRPNLSRIESGAADLSLNTIRSLALALGVTPGQLVDGIPPAAPKPLSRAALERIAGAAAGKKPALRDPEEQALADHLSALLRPQLQALGIRLNLPRRGTRRAQNAWLTLADHSPEIITSLLQRALEHAQRA